jgi:predicted DNA-binding transcriptional regulator AlpA
MKRMLDIKDLAERIGLKPQTIRNKLNCGTFPIKTKKLGRKLLWDIHDVDRFLDGLRPIN